MKLQRVQLRHFRRLEDVTIDLEEKETVFVGPNNCGKTSVSAAFRLFFGSGRFTIHDFSAAQIKKLDAFGSPSDRDAGLATDTKASTDATAGTKSDQQLPPDSVEVPAETASPPVTTAEPDLKPPTIELDLWFSVTPDTEFGRVFSLLPNVSTIVETVGIRLVYSSGDAAALKKSYRSTFPSSPTQKTLSHFLSFREHLNKHFEVSFESLERIGNDVKATQIAPLEGRRVLSSLLRVDFVDAQRHVDDQELARSNKLSAAFGAFYRNNLEQAGISDDATRIIDDNNGKLTEHYKLHFKDLMDLIKHLGVPTVNDRTIHIISSLTPEEALRGTTSLFYVDPLLGHQLPESYNGLGFKNLIYMAIQICHFQLQWIRTKEKRPLCQLIFVEEPEVHLHAQVQQTFISQIWKLVNETSVKNKEPLMVPQLAITTHSSHILDTVDFEKVRYFRRCHSGSVPATSSVLNATEVSSLRAFVPRTVAGKSTVRDEPTLKFLRQYLRLTHCDLFFADAAVLVEGAGEKLLLSEMIARSAPELRRCYIAVLEVGGAYASKFAELMKFLCIPYLVITDVDSVDPSRHRAKCRADLPGAVTSNSSLTYFLNKTLVRDLAALTPDQLVCANSFCRVTFQKPIPLTNGDVSTVLHGRTFEEAFIYDNISLFRGASISSALQLDTQIDLENDFQTTFQKVSSESFKKTDFAMDVIASSSEWRTPGYIADGLRWLESVLIPETTTVTAQSVES